MSAVSISVSALPCTKKALFNHIKDDFPSTRPVQFNSVFIQEVFASHMVGDRLRQSSDNELYVGTICNNPSRIISHLSSLTSRLYAISINNNNKSEYASKDSDTVRADQGYTPRQLERKEAKLTLVPSGAAQNGQKDRTHGNECFVGDSGSKLANNMFDILVSVSVVENVPTTLWDIFWSDQFRILKPGGEALHFISFYCDNSGPSSIVRKIYKTLHKYDGSFLLQPEDWAFQTSWCSNDDMTMFNWNQSKPDLSPIRNSHQSCSMILSITT